MKTDTSYQDKRYIYNPKPEMLDEFWNDCVDQKDKKLHSNNNNQNNNANINNNQQGKLKNKNENIYQHSQYHPAHGRNTNSQLNKKTNIKTYNSDKLFNPKNKSNRSLNSQNSNFNNNLNPTTEKYLFNIYNRHPSFIEEMKEKEMKKIKSKNALIRCLGLYAYGLELQKTMKMNKENCDIKKMNDDISLCTFKPKINKKVSYLDENKVNYGGENNHLYQYSRNKKFKKIKNRSVNDIHSNKFDDYEKYTFKPQLNDPTVVEKMFRNKRKQNKTISDEKENAEFILRYTKARDEYLIRRFKKMYRKDDNYDNSLKTLTKRLCNKQYKNYLNVNNTIYLFGETISPNEYIHSSIADFRGLPVSNSLPNQKKEKKDDYIVGLRKNLHSLDLNENQNDEE